jgi:hypothetical protein
VNRLPDLKIGAASGRERSPRWRGIALLASRTPPKLEAVETVD